MVNTNTNQDCTHNNSNNYDNNKYTNTQCIDRIQYSIVWSQYSIRLKERRLEVRTWFLSVKNSELLGLVEVIGKSFSSRQSAGM